MPEPAYYPEHEKQAKVLDDARKLGAFLEWLESDGRKLATYHEHTRDCERRRTPDDEAGYYGRECGMFDNSGGTGAPVMYAWDPPGRGERFERILAAYFGIDLEKIRDEKQRMFEELQRGIRVQS